MPISVALTITFGVGLVLRLRGKREWFAWLLSTFVMPAVVLFNEFILPYRGGGASFWTLALVIGSFYGIILGGLGVVAAHIHQKENEDPTRRRHTVGAINPRRWYAPTPLYPQEKEEVMMMKQAKNTICLWYDGDAEDAARFYAKTFPDSSVGAVHLAPGDFPSGKKGDVLTVEFTVMGIPCLGLNGGPDVQAQRSILVSGRNR